MRALARVARAPGVLAPVSLTVLLAGCANTQSAPETFVPPEEETRESGAPADTVAPSPPEPVRAPVPTGEPARVHESTMEFEWSDGTTMELTLEYSEIIPASEEGRALATVNALGAGFSTAAVPCLPEMSPERDALMVGSLKAENLTPDFPLGSVVLSFSRTGSHYPNSLGFGFGQGDRCDDLAWVNHVSVDLSDGAWGPVRMSFGLAGFHSPDFPDGDMASAEEMPFTVRVSADTAGASGPGVQTVDLAEGD